MFNADYITEVFRLIDDTLKNGKKNSENRNGSAFWEVVLPQKNGNFTDLDLDKVRRLCEDKKGGAGQLTNQSGTSAMNTTPLDTP